MSKGDTKFQIYYQIIEPFWSMKLYFGLKLSMRHSTIKILIYLNFKRKIMSVDD